MSSRADGPPNRRAEDADALLPKDVLILSERDRILLAMAAVCAERGYMETTVEAVAERAEVSLEAFATHFTGKEECGTATVSLVLAEMATVLSTNYSEDTSLLEHMVLTTRTGAEMLGERPGFAGLIHVQARQSGTEQMFGLYQASIHLLVSMLDRLREFAPTDAPLPASAARGGLGGSEALARREIAAGRPERLPRLVPSFVYGALVPILGQGEALRYARLAREQLDAKS